MSGNSKEAVAISVNDRLKAAAKRLGGDMNQALQFVQLRYVYERLLFRLQKTSFADRWAVKGGVLMLALPTMSHRATMDVDFSLLNGPKLSIGACLREISALPSDPEDGLTFELVEDGKDALRVIRETSAQPTVRGKLIAHFCLPRPNDRSFIVDVTPAELPFTAQNILWEPTVRGYQAFTVSAYPWELALAEKLHAVMTASTETPRLRDYMDVIAMGASGVYDREIAIDWMRQVLEVRGSAQDIHLNGPGLSESFAKKRQADWEGTLRRTGYAGHLPHSLSEAIAQVKAIAEPLVDGLNQRALFKP